MLGKHEEEKRPCVTKGTNLIREDSWAYTVSESTKHGVLTSGRLCALLSKYVWCRM